MNPSVPPRPHWGYHATKRAIDILLVGLTLPVTLPLGFLIAVAIRIESSGSVIFTQLRTGRDGQTFGMCKFRTMVPNAEELKPSLQHLNVLRPPDFKIPDDPRVTQVGRVLRRTSLDELPQLWNVLRGEMSLVGPRPTSFGVETYAMWHLVRLEVRPGLTGLWQLEGRGATQFDERLRLDIAYLRQRSLLTDLRILVATGATVMRGTGT